MRTGVACITAWHWPASSPTTLQTLGDIRKLLRRAYQIYIRYRYMNKYKDRPPLMDELRRRLAVLDGRGDQGRAGQDVGKCWYPGRAARGRVTQRGES
jgi:hypothetical protein